MDDAVVLHTNASSIVMSTSAGYPSQGSPSFLEEKWGKAQIKTMK